KQSLTTLICADRPKTPLRRIVLPLPQQVWLEVSLQQVREVLCFLTFPRFKPVFIALIPIQGAGSACFARARYHDGYYRTTLIRSGNIVSANRTYTFDNQIVTAVEAKPLGRSMRIPIPAPKARIHFPQNLAVNHLAALLQPVPTGVKLVQVDCLPTHMFSQTRGEPGLAGARMAFDKHCDRLHWLIARLCEAVNIFFSQVLCLHKRRRFNNFRRVFILDVLPGNTCCRLCLA